MLRSTHHARRCHDHCLPTERGAEDGAQVREPRRQGLHDGEGLLPPQQGHPPPQGGRLRRRPGRVLPRLPEEQAGQLGGRRGRPHGADAPLQLLGVLRGRRGPGLVLRRPVPALRLQRARGVQLPYGGPDPQAQPGCHDRLSGRQRQVPLRRGGRRAGRGFGGRAARGAPWAQGPAHPARAPRDTLGRAGRLRKRRAQLPGDDEPVLGQARVRVRPPQPG